MGVMKNVDDEVEVTVCYPGYGAVLSASAKSKSLGTFVHNAFRICVVLGYAYHFLGPLASNFQFDEWLKKDATSNAEHEEETAKKA